MCGCVHAGENSCYVHVYVSVAAHIAMRERRVRENVHPQFCPEPILEQGSLSPGRYNYLPFFCIRGNIMVHCNNSNCNRQCPHKRRLFFSSCFSSLLFLSLPPLFCVPNSFSFLLSMSLVQSFTCFLISVLFPQYKMADKLVAAIVWDKNEANLGGAS